MLPKDFREFIELLNSNSVRYLIVGGFAVAFHGYPRTTGDIDFLIEPEEENAVRLIRALEAFGFGSLGLTVEDFCLTGRVIQLGYPPNRIDLLTSISGVAFQDAWHNRVSSLLDGLPVTFIGKAELFRNKAATGRAQDLADLDALS